MKMMVVLVVAAAVTVVGSPVPGDLLVGSPVPGDLLVGSPVPGDLLVGSPVPGDLLVGSPVPGDLLPHAAYIDGPVIPYEFAYEVSDPETRNFQNRVEVKLTNGDVFGSWSVLLPSEQIQTVTYNVTDNQGFRYTLSLVSVTSSAF